MVVQFDQYLFPSQTSNKADYYPDRGMKIVTPIQNNDFQENVRNLILFY